MSHLEAISKMSRNLCPGSGYNIQNELLQASTNIPYLAAIGWNMSYPS
jgi:hypothetical protein